jgi:hypothetical protein
MGKENAGHPWGDPYLGRLRRGQTTRATRARAAWEALEAWTLLDSEERGKIIEAWFYSKRGHSRREAAKPQAERVNPQGGLFH